MSMEALAEGIALFGPAAVFAGAFIEGEATVVVAGYLSQQGIINPVTVAVGAFLGAFLGDLFWFFLGRRYAAHPLVARIRRRPLSDRIMSSIERNPKTAIITLRFIYGVRTVCLVAIGLTDIPTRQFVILDAVASAVCAVAFTALGYAFGQGVEIVFGKIVSLEQNIVVAVGIAFAVFVTYQLGSRAFVARGRSKGGR